MRSKWLVVVGGLVLALAVAAIVWLNGDRLFGRMVLPADSLAFAEQIKQIRAGQQWGDATNYRPKLTRADLLKSRELGCEFLVNNQKPEGNYNYEYDFVAKKQSRDDNQVRQAGALWGIALCHQAAPSDRTRAALDKGLDFFFRHTVDGPASSLTILYPGQKTVATGTVALVALAITEYLSAAADLPADRRRLLESKLDGYLKFLHAMQLPAGDFSYGTTRGVHVRIGRTSPYFDGEAQLALAKAIKYAGRPYYRSALQKAATKTAKKYTVDAWRKKQDSDDTKSFYQWGSMAFWEYFDANWDNAPMFADTVLALAWWQVYTHRILHKTRNTAYAFEGLIHAYRLAQTVGDRRAAAELARVIDRGLYQLTSWQVGGPLERESSFLRKHRGDDPLARGGILNESRKPGLRIDVTQHQMHAVILALRYVYAEAPTP
jgi:UDP-N-acetylmuramoyl-tripeptide--D-alanyl-D-alanine ligase